MIYLLKLMISRLPMNPWRIKSRFVMIKKLKLNLTTLMRFSFNFIIITNLALILKGFIGILEIINFNRYIIHVFIKLFLFRVVRFSFYFVNRYIISFTDIILICSMKLILNFLILCELSPC